MGTKDDNQSLTVIWRMPLLFWGVVLVTGLLLGLVFYDGLAEMIRRWNTSEEYGYGYLIPVITAFFIWQKKNEIIVEEFSGSWSGVFVAMLGVALYVLGELSTLYTIVQYAFLVTLYGLILAVTGWKVFRLMLVPLLFLFFMIPLPNFIYHGLSSQLQLISSELGVAFVRLFGISVYLEGNVIDLGNYRLQVVEACSGLRYLFPLAALSFMAAYIYKAAFWKRAVIFLSSVPITIFMNSFRIGVIGILVDKWGSSQAEGFLHYFEGWVIFMACMAILILEMWALTKIGGNKQALGELFAIDFPDPAPPGASIRRRRLPSTLFVSVALLAAALAATASVGVREEIYPQRPDFAGFPMAFGGWDGRQGRVERIYLDVLKLDDYIMADFKDETGEQVNLYVAYYASQSKGESAHSPRSCIPGGGWQIKDLARRRLDGVMAGNEPLTVNRLVIAKGDYRQLVYYWFQGRDRAITSEYMVKWYLFWDALTKNRTDGALVRLTAFMDPDEDIGAVDARLTKFAGDVDDILAEYIPD